MTSPPTLSLLVVDDEPDLRTLYELTLVREGYDVESAGTVEEAWGLLQARSFNALITDMRLPDGTGIDLLQRLDAAGRPEKTIVITAYGSAENAVEALKAGAYDYLTKPVDLRQFRLVVASALGRVAAEMRDAVGAPGASTSAAAASTATAPRRDRDKPTPARSLRAIERLVGASAVMRQVRALIEKVARSMAPVLVRGESGTGKELVARAIHDASPRGALPFIAVNCGAIPETLLEAEFFGYRKGAFTGANEDREGFFQAAQGGTLFLDEIGDLPLSMQSKLLRVIQERAVRAVGAVAEIASNVRIISATHRDLAEEVQGGRFRQDLFYRLNVIQIAVPPLRDRLGDLAEICAAVLERIAAEAGVDPQPTLAADALDLLARYSFPGNVRELENLLHRALALSGGELIGSADLGLPEAAFADSVQVGIDGVMLPSARPLPVSPPGHQSGQPFGQPFGQSGGSPLGQTQAPLPKDLAAHLDQVEREVLERALERYRYNRTAAGASMGLSLRQMRYRMARLGITVGDGSDHG